MTRNDLSWYGGVLQCWLVCCLLAATFMVAEALICKSQRGREAKRMMACYIVTWPELDCSPLLSTCMSLQLQGDWHAASSSGLSLKTALWCACSTLLCTCRGQQRQGDVHALTCTASVQVGRVGHALLAGPESLSPERQSHRMSLPRAITVGDCLAAADDAVLAGQADASAQSDLGSGVLRSV